MCNFKSFLINAHCRVFYISQKYDIKLWERDSSLEWYLRRDREDLETFFNPIVFVDEWGWVPSLLFDLRPNYGGGNEDYGPPSNGPMHTLPHSVPLTLKQATSHPCLHWRLLDTPAKSGLVSFGVTAPLSCVLVCTRFCL